MSVDERFLRLDGNKRDRILDTAVEEFAGHGFHQASMNRMARSLGIAKGSLFQYFGNKEGMFGFVFGHAVDLVRAYLHDVKMRQAGGDFFDRIRESLRAGIRFIDDHPHIYKIYLKILFQENFPMRAEFLEQVRFFSGRFLTKQVEAGKAEKALRSDLDTSAMVFFLDALLDRFLQSYAVSYLDSGLGLHRAGPEVIERRIGELIATLRQGLARPEIEAGSGEKQMAAGAGGIPHE